MADTNSSFVSKLTGETVSPATILSLQLAHLQEIVARGDSVLTDANVGSELRNLLESIDIAFYQNMFEINEYGEQLFLRYATGNWLDEKAYDYGYTRRMGERASGNVTFTLSTPPVSDYTIIQGTQLLNKNSGLNYILVDNVTFSVGDTTATGFVIAEGTGTEYNCEANTITVFDTEQELRSDLKVTNMSSFINGEDIESDAAFRIRITEGLRGGNFGSLQYYKSLCSEIDNVHDVAFLDPIELNNKYGQGRHVHNINGVSRTCNDCYAVCIVNCDSNDDNNDDTILAVTEALTDQDNIVLGHEFHVQDALKQKFYFKVSYYSEGLLEPTEDDVLTCLETLFYGGTYEGKQTITYPGFNIGVTIQKSEIINALENMPQIHHVESLKLLGWHNNMAAINAIEKWHLDNGVTDYQYKTILDYPDEDDSLWINHGNNLLPHWKRIDVDIGGADEDVYQLEVDSWYFYKVKDNQHENDNNSGEYAVNYQENENMYWLWGQKSFETIELDDDAIAIVGSLYELQPTLFNQTQNTHVIELEKLG